MSVIPGGCLVAFAFHDHEHRTIGVETKGVFW